MKNLELIRLMTLEEKASLMSGENFWMSKKIDRLSIPTISFADGPNGVRSQTDQVDHLGLNPGKPSTCYPTASAMASSWDTELAETVGQALGEEASAQGINVLLGPGLNMKRNPLCGRNFEYFSEDPILSGKMAAAFTRGIQSNGVSACIKHFAVNNQELHRMSNDSVLDERALREIYLTGFEIAVKEGKPLSVMSSYNKVNGSHASENRHLLSDILRDEWGFEGIVVTDWGGSHDRVAGLNAGTNVEMPSSGTNSDIEIVNAVRSGLIPETVLDRRVDEYLSFLKDLGVMGSKSDARTASSGKDPDYFHGIARKAAEESIVLLKNDESLLPLAEGTRVAVIGDFAKVPRYQGGGSSNVNPTRVDNSVDCISLTSLDMAGYEPGFRRNGTEDKELLKAALELAGNAQVTLLYIGLDEMSEVEGLERSHMRISENQISLLKALKEVNPNLVAVLSCGSAIEMPWADDCKAVLHGSLSGQAGAMAMLNVITGRVCPGGKLSESYPMRYEDVSTCKYFPGTESTTEYRESIFVGYRYFGTKGIMTRFPFGFGLSYTSFGYSDLMVDNGGVTFTITNTGNTYGAEIAQLYVGLENSEIFRPKSELKGFVKVKLQPGESRRVAIPFDDRTFRYYNVKTGRFEIEAGSYSILVGASSEDIRLRGEISKVGTGAESPYVRAELEHYYTADVESATDEEFEALLGRKAPKPHWDKSLPLTRNDTISQLYYAKSGMARLLHRMIRHMKLKAEEKRSPDLNLQYIYNMPFYGLAKMTKGMLSMEMVDSLLMIVNGRFFKGMSNLIGGYFRMRRAKKDFRESLLKAGKI
ncbi:beta-glucosidase family protein [Youngiibacter multivorans]|uniref:Beta-glucosidase n=1 Tax=Youngiibacter multivorans TaxID=937251 RepID=A0ABS4FZ87_9CLOT|nr:beta-glucosidase [Youngiibacter multivorans]MBP1917618.1 beta-glucosidase [Youngiibacter multivorans]